MFDPITNFDLSILDAIQRTMKCAFLDKFMPMITALGNAGIFWIIIAVVMLFFKKTRKTGLMMGCALVLGLLLGNLTLKPLIARIRPYDLPGINIDLLVKKSSEIYSFPSGHTLASFEAATVLMIRDKRLGVPALVIASLIAFSRLYLYFHYPTDIIGGIILGILFGILGCLIVNKGFAFYEKKKANTSL